MEKYDEYEFFAESTQYLSERRQAATKTYLSVNTAIFAVFALLVKDGGLRGANLILVSLPLFLVGLLVCWTWYKIIVQYKGLIGWRYKQLIEMEGKIKDSQCMYTKEWEEHFKPRKGKEKFGFSRLEAWLPILFAGLYIIYGIGLIMSSIIHFFIGLYH